MSLELRTYIWFSIACILSCLNALYTIKNISRELDYEFDELTFSSVAKLLVICLIPIFHIYAALVWILTPYHRYEQIIKENCTPKEN